MSIFQVIARTNGGVIPAKHGSGPVATPYYFQHLMLDDVGAVYTVNLAQAALPIHYGAGIPFDNDGRVVISANSVVRVTQGIPFANNGAIARIALGTIDHISQDLAYTSTNHLITD